jgi:hypothetical protein
MSPPHQVKSRTDLVFLKVNNHVEWEFVNHITGKNNLNVTGYQPLQEVPISTCNTSVDYSQLNEFLDLMEFRGDLGVLRDPWDVEFGVSEKAFFRFFRLFPLCSTIFLSSGLFMLSRGMWEFGVRRPQTLRLQNVTASQVINGIVNVPNPFCDRCKKGL